MILLDPEARPVVGHRGASGEYPENTLLAFDKALEQGADALEFDVRVTADGVPVVMHDATVDRTTSGRGEVQALTLSDLQTLDAGGGERVPTLANVCERYPETPFIVEIKEVAAARPAAEVLERVSAASRVVLGSFLQDALRPFGRPVFHRSASQREVGLFWAASRLGAAWSGSAFQAFAVPVRHRGRTVVDRRFVAAALRRGKPVHVWTIDRPEDARHLRSLGVSGIVTNHPGRILRSL